MADKAKLKLMYKSLSHPSNPIFIMEEYHNHVSWLFHMYTIDTTDQSMNFTVSYPVLLYGKKLTSDPDIHDPPEYRESD